MTRASSLLRSAVLGVVVMFVGLIVEAILWRFTPPSPFLLVYPAVIVAAWLGGWAAALSATAAAVIALAYLFFPPNDSIAIASPRDSIDLLVFVALAGALTALITNLKRALHEAHAAKTLAESNAAAKEMVLAVVAHDLRNPLQTIGLSSELLEHELAQDHAHQRALAKLHRIKRASEIARRLVENVLDSARVDAAALPIRPTTVTLASLLDDALAPFEAVAAARGVDLVRPSEETLRQVISCDPDRIMQVLTNLIGNSLRHTPTGGTVELAVHRLASSVRFDVIDSGTGMTDDETAHAFERLWHGNKPGHGHGLGLWIAKQIVLAHGGRIDIESHIGHGTSVSVVLPQPTPARDAASLPAGEALPGSA